MILTTTVFRVAEDNLDPSTPQLKVHVFLPLFALAVQYVIVLVTAMLQLHFTLYTVIHIEGKATETDYLPCLGTTVPKFRNKSVGLRKALEGVKHVLRDYTAVKASLDLIFKIT